jgi:hypothetical protein
MFAMFRLCLVAALIAGCASSTHTEASSAILTKVDRTLRKEPAYKNRPKYCLLVFGPKADFRVWLVQDGDVLYVDRNGNGDLTEKGEQVRLTRSAKGLRIFEAGSLSDGKLTHTDLSLTQSSITANDVADEREWKRVNAQKGGPWTWSVGVEAERLAGDTRKLPRRIGYIAGGDQNGYLLFADRTQDAPVIHFNGPWTLGLQDSKGRFTAGKKTTLRIGVGTAGIGPGSFAFVLYPDTIPETAHPQADINFPGRKKGAEPIKRKYTLKERC